MYSIRTLHIVGSIQDQEVNYLFYPTPYIITTYIELIINKIYICMYVLVTNVIIYYHTRP